MKFRRMPACRRVALVCAALASGLVCGCRTRSDTQLPGGAAGSQAEFRPDAEMAEALANFGAGILRAGQGEHDGALENLARAEALAPENARISFHLAMQYAGRGQADQAAAVMAAAAARHPDSAEVCWLQARVAQAIQRPELARQALERAVALAPRQSASHLQLALFHAGLQEDARALAVLEEALPQVDDPLPLLRILGDLYAARLNFLPDKTDAGREKALRRAIECYTQAALQPPDGLWADYQNKLGDLYILNGQFDLAIEIFTRLAERQPDDLAFRKKLALCQMETGLDAAALDQWQRIAARAPGDADAHYYLGKLYEDAGDLPAAIAALSAAVNAGPSNPLPYQKLALLLARDNLPQAIRVLEEGARRLPDSLELQDLLARLYLRARRGADALKIFQTLQHKLEGKTPGMLAASFWLGYAAAAQQSGQAEEAVKLYEKALAGNPQLLDAYVSLALLHVARNAPQPAMSVMRQALSAMPDSAEAHYFAGMIGNQAGEYAQACAAFQRAGELAPRPGASRLELDADYYFYYGTACEREKRYEQAAGLFQKALALDPDHADAANYLAYMWAERGVNLEQALWHIQHALELEPENGAYLDTLGWVYFKLGRLEEAEDEIYNALQLAPDDPTVLEHYGDILERRGNLDAARPWWLKSLERHPDNPGLREKLRRHGILPTEAPPAGDPVSPAAARP